MENINKIQIVPDEVYEVGADKVNVIPEWSVKDDSTLYEKVRKLAHSTFDSSKFTKVGSPIVTDDGIASGAANAYLSSPNAINLASADNWEIKFRLAVLALESDCPFSISTGDQNGIMIDRGDLFISSGNGWDIAPSVDIIPRDRNMYYMKLGFTGTQYYAQRSTDGVNYTTVWTNNTTTKTNANTNLMLLNWTYNTSVRYFKGEFDLKQFSITVDGVEVFSGNRTGIDTIKPDDYTVVGTPTISDDGIASGFDSSNYLTFTPTYTVNNYIQYEYEINTPSTIPTGSWGVDGSIFFRIYNAVSGSPETTVLCVDGTAKLRMIAQYVGVELATLQPNTNYKMIAKYYVNGNYEVKFYTNGSLQTFSGTGATAMSTAGGYCGIGCGMSPEGSAVYGFSQYPIDLNAFKIYVDGNLVYQPCLKIPYTRAELNQKVVDVTYRDRVKDLFEQVGYNGYHTIDEDNKNFTLPTHKFTDIIDHKEDADGTVAEQRVDMTVMAFGNATSGTDVNLPIEFADETSYMVGGVTVSAQDADSFTPSSSGTWFARGKGKI